jgi:23S rRNA pseudouridine1911/1915/1917 synthase
MRITVDGSAAGERLDRWLTGKLPELSRARLQALIDEGRVRVGGKATKAAYRLRGGEDVNVEIPPPEPQELVPERIALAIVYEDDHLVVIDKPAGMVVHPGAGHARGTLAAAVLAHAPSIATVGGQRRPGVVHRLDKGTSGLLVMAKTREAYESLVAQLASRTVSRRYVAVVHGRVEPVEGVIDKPIGRHPHDRTRMAVRPAGQGKRAVTRFKVLERLGNFTVIEARLETGRTHQIRVHMASLGHPVAGDELYGRRQRSRLGVEGRDRARREDAPEAREAALVLDGLALHAVFLAFVHPVTHALMEFTVPIPKRLERFLSHLRHTPAAREPR